MMAIDSNVQISKEKGRERVPLQTFQFYLVLVFHLSEFVSKIFKWQSQVVVFFPTFCHCFIPKHKDDMNVLICHWWPAPGRH